MGSRLASPFGTPSTKKAAGSPLSDAMQKANKAGSGANKSVKKSADDRSGKAYWESSSPTSGRMSTNSNSSNFSSCSHLQGHPKFNELMAGFPDFTQILERKIEARSSDKRKALAEQQALILQLKEAVSHLITKRDQLLEIVCTNEDVQWHQEEAFRARYSQAAQDAEERFQQMLVDRDDKVVVFVPRFDH